MTKYAVAVALSALSISVMWFGDTVFDRAAQQAASTFRYPTGIILAGVGLFALSGALLAGVLMIRAKRDRRYGYLLAAAVPPAVVVILPILWSQGMSPIPSWALWIGSGHVQGACAFALGAMLANLIWRATGPKRFEEPA